jgi:SAM-dependent methyltransferase
VTTRKRPCESGSCQAHAVSTDHFFESVADHLGSAYLRYSFTKGTEQEVAFLLKELGLTTGMRVLDVGCGPGRHSLALARRGIEVVGVDIAHRFVELATAAATAESLPATFHRFDARLLGEHEGESLGYFDAAISLCQGAFGLVGRTSDGASDDAVLAGMATRVRIGGRVAVSAFSAYFQCRHLESGDTFDASTGVNHERTEIKSETGETAETDLWTTCFTPRELRLLATAAGLTVDAVFSVTPGSYASNPPTIDLPEFLLLATVERVVERVP